MIMTTSSEALGRKDVHELSATSGSPSSRAEVGLSELSGHDYEDLKAFNEKRLWFEQRLKASDTASAREGRKIDPLAP